MEASDISLLEAILEHQDNLDHGFVDWTQPGPMAVHRACCRQAMLTMKVAEKVGVYPQQAWVAGFLAPLGWLARAVTGDTPDTVALGRLLCRSWRLPAWLSALIGNLGLDVDVVERLGVERKLASAVQLSVLLLKDRDAGLNISIGTDGKKLLHELHLDEDVANEMAHAVVHAELPTQTWEPASKTPLLVDMLQMALAHRRQNDAAWIERLQHDLDRTHAALVQQCADETQRLQAQKLSALAEFAAGAGHEINNPLAVISGQAQYALKQFEWLDVPAEDIENIGEYLDHLRSKVAPSLQKIVGQTQRIHSILTDLMQFARPHQPRLQTLSVRSLVLEIANSLQPLAQLRQVKIRLPDWGHDEYLHADVAYVRTSLSAVLRNAIEAAPAEGWASVRIEKRNRQMLDVIIEDNGKGPAANIREHLFDPFFSGRSAGRGRGMGLPTAWRLSRQMGGDVRFDGLHNGVTRFVLTLPLAATPTYAHGPHTETKIRQAIRAAV
jgi:signal transduction histidine kinase